MASARSIPEHEHIVIAPRRHRYSLVVFCINEGARLQAQLVRMAPMGDLVDIIVADGGSTDGSVEPARRGELPVRALLIKRGDGRLSAQMRMAFAFALDEGYDGIIVMDGNDKDDPTAIPDFVRLLDAGFDHVQGSRYVKGGRGINTPMARHLGVRLVHAPLISLAARFRYTDTTNGFRAYSRRFLSDPRVQPFREVFVGYELHYYLAIRAARLGFRVVETPVTRAYPSVGPVPSKIRGIRGNLGVLRTLLAAVAGHYDP